MIRKVELCVSFIAFWLLSSCSYGNSPLRQIVSDSYSIIGIHSSTKSLWLTNFESDSLEKINFDQSGNISTTLKVKLPNDYLVYDTCVSDQIWVMTSREILRYDMTENKWITYSLPSDTWLARCKLLRNYDILVFDATKIFRYHNDEWITVDPQLGDIRDAVEDEHGNYWILTSQGEIYEGTGQQWTLITKQVGQRLYYSSGAIWIFTSSEVYRLLTDNTGSNLELILADQIILYDSVDQLNYQTLWFTSQNSIWKENNASVRKIYTINSGTLSSVAAADDSLLYLGANHGVYSLHLDLMSP